MSPGVLVRVKEEGTELRETEPAGSASPPNSPQVPSEESGVESLWGDGSSEQKEMP